MTGRELERTALLVLMGSALKPVMDSQMMKEYRYGVEGSEGNVNLVASLDMKRVKTRAEASIMACGLRIL
jgi:hypothetical protein